MRRAVPVILVLASFLLTPLFEGWILPGSYSAIVHLFPVALAALFMNSRSVVAISGLALVITILYALVSPVPLAVRAVRLFAFVIIAFLAVRLAQERERRVAQTMREAAVAMESTEKAAAEERERLLTALQNQAARLSAVFEGTHAQLALLDRDFRFVMVNSAYASASGHGLEELVGQNHFTLFPDKENRVIFERVRDTGEPYMAVEKPFEYADQPWRGVTYWNWTLAPVKNAAGNVEGFVFSLLDVTAQVQARLEAERRNAELVALLQSVGEAVTIFDGQGNIVLRNEATRLLTGVPDEQAKGIGRYGGLYALHLDGTKMTDDEWPASRVLRGETVRQTEYLIVRPDGGRRRVSASGSAVRDDSGKPVLAITVMHDLTELRRLEEVRADFVRAVSHDLRQPLTAIHGHTQLLKASLERDGIDERKRRSLDGMLAGTKGMDRMIQDMIVATQLETGQLDLDWQSLDIHQFVRSTIDRQVPPSDRERVRVKEPDGEAIVRADPDRLERVVGNLLSNALAYSAADTSVTVGFVARDGEVVVSVDDLGRGVPPDELPHLFERYYRSRSERPRHEGLGLGLYISRLIVEAHGGRIWAESQSNHGSTFKFTLPAHASDRAGLVTGE